MSADETSEMFRRMAATLTRKQAGRLSEAAGGGLTGDQWTHLVEVAHECSAGAIDTLVELLERRQTR